MHGSSVKTQSAGGDDGPIMYGWSGAPRMPSIRSCSEQFGSDIPIVHKGFPFVLSDILSYPPCMQSPTRAWVVVGVAI